MKNTKAVLNVRQWLGGAIKAFVAVAAFALAGAAWGATQKIGTQTWTYDLVVEGGSTIVAKVQGVTPITAEQLTIPSTLGSYPVRIIASNAFKSQIWSGVTIPSSVTNIEASAFYGCSYMTGSLTIPANVIRIGNSAFAGCNGITSLSIKDGVKTIEREAFRACSSLTRVTIPDSVTTLGWNAFMSCTDLKKADVLGATFDGILDKEVDRDEVFNNCAPGFTLVFRETVGDITFYYTVNSDSKATIENGGERAMKPMAAASVAVPTKLGGHDVISIGSSAFEYCSMTSLSLPSGLMAIGEYAFLSCKNLAAVSFPDSLLMIGKQAFYDCDALTSVDLNKAGVILGDNAFAQCDKIKTVKFPDAIVAGGLGTGVFSSCASLESATMPASALSAISEKQVFKNCPSTAKLSYVGKTTVDGVEMAYVYIDGEGVQIGNGTSCAIDATKTGSVTIPSMIEIGGGSYPVKKIAAHAFHQCKMSSVTIPSSVTAVDWEAFASSSITSVTVPSSVRTLGAGVFENCKSLKTVTLGSGISSIPTRAFRYCDKLASVGYINNANAVTSIGDNAFNGCASLTRFTTTRSFTSLGNGAFKNCTSLEFITLPEDVFYPELYTNSELRSNIFANCQLLEISFLPSDSSSPERISLIGGPYTAWTVWAYSVVNNQARLGSIPPTIPCTAPKAAGELFSIPERLGGYLVTEIGTAAFKGCTGLKGIIVPDAVTRIGTNAFEGCTALLGVKLPANLTTIDDSAFKGCTTFTVVNVPDKVTSVAANAFSGCSNLEKIMLPKALYVYVDDGYFTGCQDDLSVMFRWDDGAYKEKANGAGWVYTIDGNEATVIVGSAGIGSKTMPSKLGGCPVTAIGDGAFEGKNFLTSMTLPDTLKTIGANAFKGCASLQSIVLPDSVTSIGAGVFSGCTAMEAASFNGNITAIPANAFYGCTSLEGVYANYNVVSIGDYAFYHCSSLQWTFPNLTTAKIVSIGKYAFAGCTSDFFNDIILGDSVTTIGDYAFINCNYNLRAISLPGSLSGVIDESKVFRDCYNISVTYRFADGSRSETINGVTYRYKIESGKATIVGATFTGNSVSIPASIAGYAVTSIANFAFKDKTSLTYLTIPDSVTFIGEGAFSGCTSLSRTGISATSNLQTVRANAYSRCALTTVTLPDSVTRIDGGAFMQNANLNRASLPGSFYNNLNVGSVFADTASDLVITYRLDEGDVMAQKVGDCTWYFKEGEGTSKVTITGVGKPSIVSVVNIPAKLGGSTVGTIGGYVFDQMSDVTSITIPNGVTTIESYAFYKCTGLTSIEIPRSVTSLKNNAFTGCSNLTSASLPDTLNYIDETAVFPNCPASLVITFRDKSGRLNYTSGGKTWWYRIVDGGAELYYSEDYSASHQAVSPKPTGALVIPDTINSYPVTKIGKYAFYDYGDMTSVSIPATVREIDENAFWLCSSLTTVNFASGSALSTIGKNAFRQSGLTGISLPDGLTSIGISAFEECQSLSTVSIPDSVNMLGATAFRNCSALTSVALPDTLTEIGDGVFRNCTSLTDVTLKTQFAVDSFMRIFDRSYVKNVTIAEGVTAIGDQAFCYDRNDEDRSVALESVTLPESLESIGAYAFRWSKLKSLTIPRSVTSIGKYAFADCAKLTSVSIPAHLAGENVGECAFMNCTGLTSVKFEDGATSIGATSMFSTCSGLTSVKVPDGVVSIIDRTFDHCYSLQTLTIPQSVQSVGANVFRSAGLATVNVAARDTDRVKAMLVASGLEESFVNGLTFVEALPDFWFITFNGNGGTASEPQYNIAPNANLGTLPTATRENYDFLGWFTEAEGGPQILPTTKATGDVTYYAHWKHNQYTVTIDTGTGSTTSVPIDHGTTIGDVLETITQPTREGYTFKGWVDADDEPLDLLAPVTADTTFIAVWAKNVVVDCYAVLDGELQPKSAWYLGVDGVEGDVLDVGPQFIDGYVFLGWSAEPAGELLTGTIIAAEGLTLYAQFTLDAWTVTFDANGGDCDTISVKVAKGEKLESLPEATRLGFVQNGWWTAADGGEQIVANWTEITGDITAYAHWTPVATVDGYAYTYKVEDGKATIYDDRGLVAVSPWPTGVYEIPAMLNGVPVGKIGHGAFALVSITEVVIPDGVTEIGSGAFNMCQSLTTVTLPKSVTTIGISAFGGCDALATFNVEYGDTSRVKAMLVASGLDQAFVNGLTFVEAEAPKFTVTLDPNGGSVDPTSVDVAEGAKVSALLPTPAYPGFSFTGWFTAAEGGEKVTAETTATADVTYFAQWTALTAYTVTLDANGGTVALDNILVYAGEKIGDLPTPEKEGFRFTAWKQGSTTVTKDTVVNADMTIIAQWEEIHVASEFTVTFDVNGGTLASGSASITVTEGQKVGTKLPSATRTGYEFTGWKVSDLLWVDADTVVTENLNCTAQWQPNTYAVTYNANGGTIGGVESMTTDVFYDGAYSLPTPDERVGWTFAGWFTKATGGDQVKNGDTVTITAAQTLYAHWTDAGGGGGGGEGETTYGTETVGGYTYSFKVVDGKATIVNEDPSLQYKNGDVAIDPLPVGELTIPATLGGYPVVGIGYCAFMHCNEMTDVTIPSGVTMIDDWAFAADALTRVTIPASVTSIGAYAFYKDPRMNPLRVVYVSSASEKDRVRDMLAASGSPVDTIAFIDTTGPHYTVTFGSVTREYYAGEPIALFPEVTRNGYTFNAWYDNYDLRNRVTEDFVITEATTFYARWTQTEELLTAEANGYVWSYKLDGKNAVIYNNGNAAVSPAPDGHIDVPAKLGSASVVGIGDYAFYGCDEMTSVKIPDSVKTIGQQAFAYCFWMECVDCGKNVASIGSAAFYECGDMLAAVQFRGTKKPTVDSLTDDLFEGTDACTVYVNKSAKDWPLTSWQGRPVVRGDYMVNVKTAFYDNEKAAYCKSLTPSTPYALGKKVTLKATENKGYVFAGWFDRDGVLVSRTASYAYTVTGEDVTFYADFYTVQEDIDDLANGLDEVTLTTDENGVFIDDIMDWIESHSEPKLTFKGLPTGLKFDSKTYKITGKATKPGIYTVTASLTNKSVKKALTATFMITVPNFVDELIELEDAYGEYIPGVEYKVNLPQADGWSVSGLPTGMKWTAKSTTSKTLGAIEANSAYGAPTKPGNYTVYFTKTVNKVKHTATATFVVSAFPVLTVERDGNGLGAIKGDGPYAANKKVSLKATPVTGSVFQGWYTDYGELISQAASCNYIMPEEDTTLIARFITADEDRDGIVTYLNFDDIEDITIDKDSPTSYTKTILCGVYLKWSIAVEALSLPTVKVSGLPTGLKFTAKDIYKKGSKTEVEIPANTIYGTPTAASKTGKPSVIKVTVTTAGKTKVEYSFVTTVQPIADWAVGSFNGGGNSSTGMGKDSQLTLTVTAAGKVSGKYIDADGLTWTLSAANFYDGVSDESDNSGCYTAMVTGKNGKSEFSDRLLIQSEELGGVAYLGEEVTLGMAYQNNWKKELWNSVAKTFSGTYQKDVTDAEGNPFGSLTLKFATSGAVTVKGDFIVNGAKYSASGSTVLIPWTPLDAEGFSAFVHVYFPPKTGKFPGFVQRVDVYWSKAKGLSLP